MANGPGTDISARLRGQQLAGGFTPIDLRTQGANTRPRNQQAPTPTPAPTPKGNSRGERNNNPGNLEDGSFTRSQPGYVGSDGRFAKFDTAANGEAAQVNLLRKNYRGMSIAQIVQKYAPPGDNSEASIRNYIGYVSARTGLNPDSSFDDNHYHQVAAAMRAFETGKTGTVKFKPYGGTIRAASGSAGGGGASRGKIPVQGSQVPGPRGGMNTGIDNQSSAIFAAGPEMARKQGTVQQRVNQAGAVLDNMLAQMNETQAGQIEAKQTQVNTVTAINQQMTEATAQETQRAIGVFQRQQQIADKLIENQTMSPIARAVRGFFDLNYNDQFLMNQMKKNNAILDQVGQTYRQMNAYQADAINQSETLYQLTTALPNLRLEHLGQQAKAAEMNLQQAQTDLDVTMTGVRNEVGLIQSQNAARTDILSRIDGPTALSLLGQAEQSGDGVVVFNGVPLGAQELRERAQSIEKFNDSVEMSKMALANGRADLADKQSARMVEYATDAQIEQGIKDGGVIEGVQIAPGLLTQEKQRRAQAAINAAEIRENESTPMQAAQTALGLANYSRDAASRMDSIFGPNSVADEQINFSNKIRDLSMKIREGTERGASDIEMGVLRNQLLQAKQGFDQIVAAKVKRLVGNDEQGAAYVMSYMLNDRPTPNAAAEMLVHFASKGGLPGAIQTSPFAYKAMEQVMTTLDNLRGSKVPGTNRIRSDKQIEAEAIRLLADPKSADGQKLRSAISGAQFVDSFRQLPQIAAAAGHSFGKINPSQYQKVLSESDGAGYFEAAKGLGVNGSQLRSLLTTGKADGVAPERAKEIVDQKPQILARVGTFQQRALVARLDQIDRASQTMRNSQLMSDFLASPQGASAIQSLEGQSQYGGFVDWMAGSVGKGGLGSKFSQYLNGFDSVVHEADVGYMNESMRMASAYRNDPIRRMGSIMAGLGLNRGEIMKLSAAVSPLIPKGSEAEQTLQANRQMFDARGSQNPGEPAEYLTSSTSGPYTDLSVRQINAIDTIIQSHKFDDPEVEKIRKEVAKDWRAASKSADSLIDSVLGRGNYTID